MMTIEEAISTIKAALAPEQLTDLQQNVLRRVWKNESYIQIAQALQYNHSYIKDVGAGLWRLLSQSLGERVSKHNLRRVLVHYQEQQMSAHTNSYPSTVILITPDQLATEDNPSFPASFHASESSFELNSILSKAFNQQLIAIVSLDKENESALVFQSAQSQIVQTGGMNHYSADHIQSLEQAVQKVLQCLVPATPKISAQ